MSFLKKLAERTAQVANDAAQAAAEKYDALRASDEIREARYELCKACPNFISITTTCSECGCFMAAKTYLADAECPIGKWQKISQQGTK